MMLDKFESYFALIDAEIAEDVGTGDVTTEAIGINLHGKGYFVAKANGVLAGVDIVCAYVRERYAQVKLEFDRTDGERVEGGDIFGSIEGPVADVLLLERTILNIMQHLGGIATATRVLVDAIEGTRAVLLDTRKTLPGLRKWQKYAVRQGGGVNHRYALYDQVLLKDNHLSAVKETGVACHISQAIKQSRAYAKEGVKVEVEVETLEDMLIAAEAGADYIMLDNMTIVAMTQAVETLHDKYPDGKRPLLEASGNVTAEKIRAIAQTGVDRISVGSITHSVIALDISLRFEI